MFYVHAHAVRRDRVEGPRGGRPFLVQRLQLLEQARLPVLHEIRVDVPEDSLNAQSTHRDGEGERKKESQVPAAPREPPRCHRATREPGSLRSCET